MDHLLFTNGPLALHKWTTCSSQMDHLLFTNGPLALHKWTTCSSQMDHLLFTNGPLALHKWTTCSSQMDHLLFTNGPLALQLSWMPQTDKSLIKTTKKGRVQRRDTQAMPIDALKSSSHIAVIKSYVIMQPQLYASWDTNPPVEPLNVLKTPCSSQ